MSVFLHPSSWTPGVPSIVPRAGISALSTWRIKGLSHCSGPSLEGVGSSKWLHFCIRPQSRCLSLGHLTWGPTRGLSGNLFCPGPGVDQCTLLRFGAHCFRSSCCVPISFALSDDLLNLSVLFEFMKAIQFITEFLSSVSTEQCSLLCIAYRSAE